MDSRAKKTQGNADDSAGAEMLRRFKANPGVFIGTFVVLVLVIVSFVLVPAIVPAAGRMPDFTFGTYDKVPISYAPGNFFANYREMLVEQYQQYGMDPSNTQVNYQIWRMAFESAAYRTAVLQEMKKANYVAPVKIVDREAAKQFEVNGRFSQALYDRWDSTRLVSLRRQTQEGIAVDRYNSDIDGLIQPDAQAAFMEKMAFPRREFDMVVFPVDQYPDSEIAAYAKENDDLFTVLHLSRITVNSSEREAKQILKSIQDEATTFEDAAIAKSSDAYADRGGFMGTKLAHELMLDIPSATDREKVIALAKNEYSPVIKLHEGWAFFRADENSSPVDVDSAEILYMVRAYIQSEERGRMEDWATSRAQQFIALVNQTSFSDALHQMELTKQSFGPIPLNYGNVDLFDELPTSSVWELSNSAEDERFWKMAFGTKLNKLSEPFVQGSNVLVLCPVREINTAGEGEDSVQDVYQGGWIRYTNQQSQRAFFLSSSKMQDRFMEAFLQYLMPRYDEEE